MTWRSRSLRVLPIAFPLLIAPDATWAPGQGPRARLSPRPPSPLSPSRLWVRPSVRLRPVRMRLVSGMQAPTRPRLAAVLRQEDTGRARAARGEAADRGEQIRGEIDAPVH
jgi:hypothetical protein